MISHGDYDCTPLYGGQLATFWRTAPGGAASGSACSLAAVADALSPAGGLDRDRFSVRKLWLSSRVFRDSHG